MTPGAAELLFLGSDWILTLALHGVALSAAALLAGRLLPRPAARDRLWKAALVLPLVTATAAVARPGAADRAVDVIGLARTHLGLTFEPTRIEIAKVRRDGVTTTRTSRSADPRIDGFAAAVVLLATAGAVIAAIRLVRRRRAWARLIADRHLVPVPRATRSILARHERLARRFTTSARLASPVAMAGGEVCLPAGFFGLPEAQQRSIVAHELIHLERRDPLWFAVGEVVTALAWFQPLARPVVAALRRDAEFLCDAGAVGRTGDRIALVEALAHFASAFDRLAAEVPSGARYDASPLMERADQLLVPRRSGPVPGWRRLGLAVASLGLVAGAALLPPVRTNPLVAEANLDGGGRLERRVIVIDEGDPPLVIRAEPVR